jgi:acyl carrier protein
MDNNIFPRVRNIIANQLGMDEEDIELTDILNDDFGMDDLDLVEIVFALEAEFDCEISDDLSGKWKTVSDIIDLMSSIENSPE